MAKKDKKYTILDKMVEDNKVLNECIRKGGDFKQVTKDINVKIAMPIDKSSVVR